MRRLVSLAALCCLVLAGCGSSADKSEVDRATVDIVLDAGASGVRSFESALSAKTPADLQGLLAQAASSFSSAAAELRPTPRGVPEAVARGADSALRQLAASLRALGTCVSAGAAPSECAETVKQAGVHNQAAAEALRELIPFGTKTRSDLAELFGSQGNSTTPAATPDAGLALAKEACTAFAAAAVAGPFGSSETASAFAKASVAARNAATQSSDWEVLADKVDLVAQAFSGDASVDQLDAGIAGVREVQSECSTLD